MADRKEVSDNGQIITVAASALPYDLNVMTAELFSQNSWIYNEKSRKGAYRNVTLTSPDGSSIVLDLFTANVRDEKRSETEKKIQLGGADPRAYKDNITIVLGFYVNNSTAPLKDAIIVGYPIKESINYSTNPSLRSTTVDGILLDAKRNGISWDSLNMTVAFRPEFIFYYLQNYKKFHGYSSSTASYKLNPITHYISSFPRNLIIFGAPGTGKSYYLNKKKDELLISGGGFERVTFHPDYTYSQFVGSYKPVTEPSGEIKYKFVPGPFLRSLVKAYKQANIDETRPYLLIIEEINRAKASAVFGEVFQLLDRKMNVSEYSIMPSEDIKKYLAEEFGGVPTLYDEIKIPDNMFIWATMNSADQGVFVMDTAFKRRWKFKYIGVDEEEFSGSGASKEQNVPGKFNIAGEDIEWNVLRRAINAKLSSKDIRVHEDKLIGPFFIYTKDMVDTTEHFKNEDEFIDELKEKVLMYLFEDAAKTKRMALFEGCQESCNKYSSICEKFDSIGIKIFGDSFKKDYYDVEKTAVDDKFSKL